MPLKPTDGGGERSKRGIVASRVRFGRVLLRPWIEGRLRIEERAAAVGSVLIASFLAFFSSGSRQILSGRCQLRPQRLSAGKAEDPRQYAPGQ